MLLKDCRGQLMWFYTSCDLVPLLSNGYNCSDVFKLHIHHWHSGGSTLAVVYARVA